MPVAARAHRPALPPGDPIRHDRTVDQVPVADRDPDHRLDVEDLGDVVVRASDGRFGSGTALQATWQPYSAAEGDEAHPNRAV